MSPALIAGIHGFELMPDAHYDNPVLAELYDVQCGWSEDRDFYFSLAGEPPQSILDLGCGTGLLCNAYAASGHSVTGVDPSPAMIDVARGTAQGATIDWVAASAETYRSEKRFDLIIMTGHAFQVLLEDSDIDAAFSTIRHHLKPDGVAVFESRNPALDWARKWHGEADNIDFRGVLVRYSVHVLAKDGDRLTFEQRYAFPNETLPSVSVLRFPSQEQIETQLARAGLATKPVLGDWRGGPFDPATSEEMIFRVRRA